MTKAVLYPGRFQPFHAGHAAIVRKVLAEGYRVVIGLRLVDPGPENPYTWLQVVEQIRRQLGDDERVRVVPLPDFTEIVHGRRPGWGTRRIDLPDELEEISATRTRAGAVIWITGQSGAGKTTLAEGLKAHYIPSAVILDGNDMRATISETADFSRASRTDHNLRVARLAALLAEQGHIVIVAVIAPYTEARRAVEPVAHPVWVYLTRTSGQADREAWPYEPPDPDGVFWIDNREDGISAEATREMAWNYVRRLLFHGD